MKSGDSLGNKYTSFALTSSSPDKTQINTGNVNAKMSKRRDLSDLYYWWINC